MIAPGAGTGIICKERAVEPTPGKAFYQRQIAALEARDMDALLRQYHPDASMIGFDFTVKGHAAIRTHLEGYLERPGTLKLKSTDKFTETEDAIFFELHRAAGNMRQPHRCWASPVPL
jgi:hypothetical protein